MEFANRLGDCRGTMTRAACAAEKPFVSVIIPARNEAGFIGRALDSILAGDYPADRMEIVVADGMSTDGTRERIAEYAARDRRVRMIDNPGKITPAGLNRAIDASEGEIIARIDAHAAVAPDYLSLCVQYLESESADNVGGRMQTLAQSRGPFSESIVAALSHRFGVGNSYFRTGSAQKRWVDTVFGGCWRRSVFDRVGKFNERLERSQDMEFSLRLKAAGGKTLLAPDVSSTYYARTDFLSFCRHNFLNGQWAVLPFLYSGVIPVSVRHLIPLIFVAALAVGAAALPWTPWPLGMIAIPYLLFNLAASIHVAWRDRKLSMLALMPIVFLSLHAGYGFGSAAGILRIIRIVIHTRIEETSCFQQL